MTSIILYHGSTSEHIVPTYGLGDDKHDYGRGFYLTSDQELAKEWSVSKPDYDHGWVHEYELCTDDLKILDFTSLGILAWLAELMKHRDADESRRYKVLSAKFIEKDGVDTTSYDVIKGWRADASYFYIAKEFVRDNIDVDILEELLCLGSLGIQICLKSEKAFSNLKEIETGLISVDYATFNAKYNDRDSKARDNMRRLINSEANSVTKVFSSLL